MSKQLMLNLGDVDEVCNIGKALSSPVRLEILKLLNDESLNIGEISERLHIAPSSASLHVNMLESAKLIDSQVQLGTRGTVRLCSKKRDNVNISLLEDSRKVSQIESVNMPIGAFTDCEIHATCGIADEKGRIGSKDSLQSFYLPDRMGAQIIWTSKGYVEYKFPNQLPKNSKMERVFISLEVGVVTPNECEDWKSDITVWINGVDCGTLCISGDFGARSGRLTPSSSSSDQTQYGFLTTWEIRKDGCYINNNKVGVASIASLSIEDNQPIVVRIGNKQEDKYVNGFSIFGEKLGDYPQNIILSLEY